MKKKLFLPTLLMSLSLVGPLTAQAYSKSVTYDFLHGFRGTTDFSLAAKTTKFTAKANTYNPSDAVVSAKETYKVTLVKSILGQAGPITFTANGISTTKSFGVIKSGTYNLDFTKPNSSKNSITGSGTVTQ